MNYFFSLLALILFSLNQIDAQSTERFIRIVGNSRHEFISDGTKIDFIASEVIENPRTNQKALSYDSVIIKLNTVLKNLNINISNLESNSAASNRNYGGVSKSFVLNIDEKDKSEKFLSTKMEGIQIQTVLYTYKNISPVIQETMLLNAIDDAKRKAKNITKELNLKLGKILNIEDTSGGCCGEIKETKEMKTSKNYSVTITFELSE